MKTVVFLTGVSGSDRKELSDELRQAVKESAEWTDSAFFDIGDLMFEVADERNVQINDRKILDVQEQTRKLVRSLAIDKAADSIHIAEDRVQLFCVGIHALFRWKTQLIPGITGDDVDRLLDAVEAHKKYFFAVNDDVSDVLRALGSNPKWTREEVLKGEDDNGSEQLELSPDAWWTISTWIEEENFLTKFLAETFGATYALIPRKMGGQQLKCFLAESDRGKRHSFYLSYPITHAEKDEEIELEFTNFKGEMTRNGYVIFDPLYINDLGFLRQNMRAKADPGYARIERQTEKRTIARDFQLISQSNFMLVYYKYNVPSPGVQQEILYASLCGIPVYTYYPFDEPSPFLKQHSTYVARDIEAVKNRIACSQTEA